MPKEGSILPYHPIMATFQQKTANRMILTSVVLSQYTRVTDGQTERYHYYDTSWTLQSSCNIPLKTSNNYTVDSLTRGESTGQTLAIK